MTDTENAALERRIDELCAEVEAEKQRNAKLFEAAEKWMAKAAHFEAENAKLRELVRDMWQLINDLDATPYVTERHGNNPAVTWIDDDWSVHESCRERMRELGVEL